MNKKLVIVLLSSLTVSIVVGSDNQRAACARRYATDLFNEKYGFDKDKWWWPKHGGNIHAFMQEFPQCKIAYGSNEQQIFQNAVAYAREEGMNYCPAQPEPMKPAISAAQEIAVAALFLFAGWIIKPKDAENELRYCGGWGLQIAGGAALFYFIKKEVREARTRREQWKATARAIVVELSNYNFTRERQENFSQIKSERAL